MHKLYLLYSWLIRVLLYFFPDMPIIMKFRGYLYSIPMSGCKRNFQVASSANLKGLENITIGKNCFFASNTIIDASTKLILNDDVMIGYSSIIVTGNHSIVNGSYRFGKPIRRQITIGRGTWIGANCVILPGVSITNSCCVAAGSVVNKSITEPGVFYRKSSPVIKPNRELSDE
ncbi:acyltransferase [Providencia hangzhouensis]|uniref:Galactoside O-acetyltransferase n=2 Tax=Providencia TaxID=586 RepID=A0A9N8D6T1_PRORE|nr:MULTISPECIES: acyltransferase [Providencia]MBN7844329.1 acyltransferase [Providencia rettgeri]MBN7856268.1 acyltransferase [Providencia rettgeri]MBN7864386.1 acyltransferase [Providencia rettgeri]MBN7874480.1 acyltransferase [Providencia rettgeri]MBN7898916.1 acyltransferase [Providencia rettgeri]